MLTQVCNLSPGDDVVTGRYSGKLSKIVTSDDGAVCLEFDDGNEEWLESRRIVVKLDKHSTFFVPDPVH